MRKGFEEAMRNYGKMAKGEQEAQKSGAEKLHNAQVKRTYKGRAEETGTTNAAQKFVFGLQRQKQELMARLKEEIAALDAPEKGKGERPPNAREVVSKDGALMWRKKNGSLVEITVGEMVTDGVWGIEYHADEETVPRVIRKRMLVERTQRRIQELLDKQIDAEEVSRIDVELSELAKAAIEGSDDDDLQGRIAALESMKRAYTGYRERGESGALPHGIIAEKMSEQLVCKEIFDKQAPYSFERGNVFQDVVRKMDFVIRRADYGRGVKIDRAEHDLGSKALQLTINADPQTLRRKMSQIEKTRRRLTKADRIDDIALVKWDQRTIADAYQKWKDAGSPPGGPDKMLSKGVREGLFGELVKGM